MTNGSHGFKIRTDAPWRASIGEGLCDGNGVLAGNRGGGGGGDGGGDNDGEAGGGVGYGVSIAPVIPWSSKVCTASASVFKALHTLPVECWERTGKWDQAEGNSRHGRWSIAHGAWALVAFAWAPLFGLLSLLFIVALGWTMNGASTRGAKQGPAT